MKLSLSGLKDKDAWECACIALPEFDIDAMREYTEHSPEWIHFGAGNIFRGFIACLQQDLLEKGLTRSGIIAADTFDFEIIDKIYAPYDNLSILVTLHADGSTEKKVVASVSESIKLESLSSREKLQSIFSAKSLKLVSFTVTEKAYALTTPGGEYLPDVTHDIDHGPDNAVSLIGVITSLLYTRYNAGGVSLALVSMDNCSRNGEKLKDAVLHITELWEAKGYVELDFRSWIDEKVSFPWTMIDKITPRPDENVRDLLESSGLSDMDAIITSRDTYIAPFVNAEAAQYLVIEDDFPNGRPPLERAGVFFTDRETVNKTETMKVTTCLNPLHTALSIFGCMLGYTRVSDEMSDPDIRKLIELIGYREGLPVVTDPGIISPESFLREVINERFSNPFIPDTPQRIVTDTSQKLASRFGETIKSYIQDKDRDVKSLVLIPLTIAAWFRYMLRLDDKLCEMPLSPDPYNDEFSNALSTIKAGVPESYTGQLRPLLSNKSIFLVDLCDAGLAEKIEEMFVKMLKGKGAVRAALCEYLEVER